MIKFEHLQIQLDRKNCTLFFTYVIHICHAKKKKISFYSYL